MVTPRPQTEGHPVADAGWVGSLDETPLASVLCRIALEERSGDLQITTPSAIKTVYFDRGFIVFASSNLKNERLGESMIQAGRISAHEFALASMVMKSRQEKFGKALVSAGILSEEELGRQVAAQVNRIVLSLFSMKNGMYSFDERPCSIPLDLMVSLSVYRIVIEGVRRMSSKKLVLAGLGSLNTKLQVVDLPPFTLDAEKLRDVEKAVLAAANVPGGRTVAWIVQSVSANDGFVLRACYGLYSGGLLEAVSHEPRTKLRVQEETGTFVLSEIHSQANVEVDLDVIGAAPTSPSEAWPLEPSADSDGSLGERSPFETNGLESLIAEEQPVDEPSSANVYANEALASAALQTSAFQESRQETPTVESTEESVVRLAPEPVVAAPVEPTPDVSLGTSAEAPQPGELPTTAVAPEATRTGTATRPVAEPEPEAETEAEGLVSWLSQVWEWVMEAFRSLFSRETESIDLSPAPRITHPEAESTEGTDPKTATAAAAPSVTSAPSAPPREPVAPVAPQTLSATHAFLDPPLPSQSKPTTASETLPPVQTESVGVPAWSLLDGSTHDTEAWPEPQEAVSYDADPQGDDPKTLIESLGVPSWSMRDDPKETSESARKSHAIPTLDDLKHDDGVPVVELYEDDEADETFGSGDGAMAVPAEMLDSIDSELFIEPGADTDEEPSLLNAIPVETVTESETEAEAQTQPGEEDEVEELQFEEEPDVPFAVFAGIEAENETHEPNAAFDVPRATEAPSHDVPGALEAAASRPSAVAQPEQAESEPDVEDEPMQVLNAAISPEPSASALESPEEVERETDSEIGVEVEVEVEAEAEVQVETDVAAALVEEAIVPDAPDMAVVSEAGDHAGAEVEVEVEVQVEAEAEAEAEVEVAVDAVADVEPEVTVERKDELELEAEGSVVTNADAGVHTEIRTPPESGPDVPAATAASIATSAPSEAAGTHAPPHAEKPRPPSSEGDEDLPEREDRDQEMLRIKHSGGEARLFRDVKLHFKMHDWEGAVSLLKQLIEISPGSPLYRGLLARAMSRHPRMRKHAEGAFVEALRLAPQDPQLHYWLGLYYNSFGLKSRAITEFRTTLRIDPSHEGARKQLGANEKKDAVGGVLKKLFG